MKLTSTNLLNFFSSPENRSILNSFSERTYPRKTLIHTPYDNEDTIFIVKSGRLRIFLSYEDREFSLAVLEPGDIFSTHAKTYAETLDETVILTGSTVVFQQKIIETPEMTLTIVKVLGEVLKNSIAIIEGLALKDVRQRFCDFLEQMVINKGYMTPDGMTVELGLGMEDIAGLLGTTRQTVSMLLNEYIKNGVLERTDRQRLLVRNPDLLKQYRRKKIPSQPSGS